MNDEKKSKNFRLRKSVRVALERAEVMTNLTQTDLVEAALKMCLEDIVRRRRADMAAAVAEAEKFFAGGKLFEPAPSSPEVQAGAKPSRHRHSMNEGTPKK